ncbi:hypothetical protein HHK36_025691 [Tetracentron sinense]|uniref:Serine incorporator n=1 Tax=Tetracentron sinense TaxID=13715 RepID=A0A834YKX9_TETSI|nr:hypothetical protein HHK36_025691 [Tetracentron sinense]
MDSSTSSSSDTYVVSMENSFYSQFCPHSNPWMARYVYGLIFLITNLLAWAIRDYGHGALTEMERLKGCHGGRDCLGTEGVLRVNTGSLTPGLMGLYVVFICWCAIRSEPPEESCNKKAEAAAKTDWLTITSFIIALVAMVIATFSTGIDSKSFQVQFRKDDTKAIDDVPYGYGFFHFVFAMGAMYFAMLLVSWNTHHDMRKWTIDVGWTSTWVKIVNEWLAACIYKKGEESWNFTLPKLLPLTSVIRETTKKYQPKSSIFQPKHDESQFAGIRITGTSRAHVQHPERG